MIYEILCPNCGSKDVWKNSYGELQCDNCGFEEVEDERLEIIKRN